MNIKSISIISMLLLSLFSFSQQAIEGKWKSEENGTVIEVYSQNNMFFGKTINVPDTDSNVEIGHVLLNSLVYNNATKKYEGKVKLTSGFTARCEIELINEDKFQLKVTKLFFRKVQTFIRI